jgi:L-iditol 2-dehydrogenase
MVGGEPNRLELAREFGADITININEVRDPMERVKMVRKETLGGHGADVVLECAGVPQAVPEGIDYLRYGGRYCEAGHFSDAGTVLINPSTHICAKCATIVGAWSSTPDQFIKALNVLREKRFPFEKIITHKLPLERLEEAFKALSSDYIIDGKEVIKAVVVP